MAILTSCPDLEQLHRFLLGRLAVEEASGLDRRI